MPDFAKGEGVGVVEYVLALAKQHGIVADKTRGDVLAEAITRLSGDEVVTDGVEDLIVALRRAHVIDSETMVSLLGESSTSTTCSMATA